MPSAVHGAEIPFGDLTADDDDVADRVTSAIEDGVGPFGERREDRYDDADVAELALPHPGVGRVGVAGLPHVQLGPDEAGVELHDEGTDVLADVEHHRTARRRLAGLVNDAVGVAVVMVVLGSGASS